MRLIITCLLISGAVGLAGCSTPKVVPVAAEPDIVTVKLAQAADKASQALDSIAKIEQYRGPAIQVDDYSGAPPNLMQPITLRWAGPMEAVVKVLAERAGLQFRTKGNPPAAPVTVSFDIYQQPLLQVLRQIGLQAGHRADLAVDGVGGVIEVRYAPSDLSQ